jgi:cytochrome c
MEKAVCSRSFVTALTMAILFGSSPVAADVSDLEAAREQFLKSCGTCHTVDPEGGPRQGPNLHGVYGRRVGQSEGFQYSDALSGGDWTWTKETLDPWIENAQKAHPGTIMNYRQRSAEKRALIIAYLKSLSSGN